MLHITPKHGCIVALPIYLKYLWTSFQHPLTICYRYFWKHAKYQTDDWFLGSFFLIKFFYVFKSLLLFVLMSLPSISCKAFCEPYFFILFEFVNSVNCVTDTGKILSILCSKKVHVRYLALFAGLPYLPSLQKIPSLWNFRNYFFSSFNQASLANSK